MQLTFRKVSINRGRVFVELENGRRIDVTGGLADPMEVIDQLMAGERTRQMALEAAGRKRMADELRKEIIDENARWEGWRI